MKHLLLAAATSMMLLTTAAMASPGHGHGHGNGDGNDNGRGHGNSQGDEDGHASYRHPRWTARHHVHHDNGLHLGQYKFARGERVPDMYMQPRYYVEDYRVYHLAPPPRGYRWVRPDDGRYLLISTATGLISQILGY